MRNHLIKTMAETIILVTVSNTHEVANFEEIFHIL